MHSFSRTSRSIARAFALTACAAIAINTASAGLASDVSINFTVDKVIENSVVNATGQIRNRISKIGDISFDGTPMTRDRLGMMVFFYMSLEHGTACIPPTTVHVADPTKGAGADNLFSKYGWEPVSRVLRPIKSHLVSTESTPQAVLTEPVSNAFHRTATVSGSASDSISNSISWSWSRDATAGAEQTFKYTKSFGFFGEMEAETKISISGTVGEAGEEVLSDTVVNTLNLSTEIEPGENVAFLISASRGKIIADVTYEESYTGVILANWADKCDGHHHWAIPIRSLLENEQIVLMTTGKLGIPPRKTFVERLELNNYTNINGSIIAP